jgi:hypothetical protein
LIHPAACLQVTDPDADVVDDLTHGAAVSEGAAPEPFWPVAREGSIVRRLGPALDAPLGRVRLVDGMGCRSSLRSLSVSVWLEMA